MRGAKPETVPDKSAGGPPRREDLTMTTDEMARRALEDATEADGEDAKREPDEQEA